MIKVKNLTYSYPENEKPSVKGINFEISKGEIFGFLGPSGAGKSTTQKILYRLLSPFNGDISVLSKNLKSWGSEYYNHIGVCFELPNHYLKLTASENLAFFSSFYNAKTRAPMELLEMVELDGDADRKVEYYSKGMKMRLNFIRALIHNPEILFFYEPTSGMDPVNARIIKNIILDLKSKGKTIFITTHNMYDADELCDRVAFIIDGEIKTIDTPKLLKLQGGKRKLKIEYLDRVTDGIAEAEFDLDGLGANESFLDIIKTKKIQSIHSEEATLEDIFIKVTGRTLS